MIEIRAPSPGTITNQASVTSDAHDPVSSNDSASAETTVDPAANLSLDEDRLARPGARRRAARLHAHGAQRGSRRTPPGRRSPTRCRQGSRSTPRHRPRAAARESSGTVTCALGTIADEGNGDDPDPRPPVRRRHDHEPGQSSVLGRRPEHREQLRLCPDDRHRRRRRLPTPQGGFPAAGFTRPGLQRVHSSQPPARAAARLRVVQPTRAALGLPDDRQPGRQQQAVEHGRLPAPGGDPGRSRWTRRGRRGDHGLDHRRT